MDANGREKGWNEIFPDESTRPDFNEVYNGKRKLSDEEIDHLYDYSIQYRENQLIRSFGSYWRRLKPNERLAIEDKFFQSNNVNVIKNDLVSYVNSDDENYLIKAVNTLSYNPQSSVGIQKRRNATAVLLNSTKCPLYSKPSEAPMPYRYKYKLFRWIWHNTGSPNPNKYHRDQLNGKEFSILSNEWKIMTSERLKGCHCTYEIIN